MKVCSYDGIHLRAFASSWLRAREVRADALMELRRRLDVMLDLRRQAVPNQHAKEAGAEQARPQPPRLAREDEFRLVARLFQLDGDADERVLDDYEVAERPPEVLDLVLALKVFPEQLLRLLLGQLGMVSNCLDGHRCLLCAVSRHWPI